MIKVTIKAIELPGLEAEEDKAVELDMETARKLFDSLKAIFEPTEYHYVYPTTIPMYPQQPYQPPTYPSPSWRPLEFYCGTCVK